ncbi:MAG: hypothetical protein ACP5FK_09980 [bacterium]
MLNWKFYIAWIPGIPIAILNGIIRNNFYQRFLLELKAHQLSAVSFIVLFGFYVWLILKWLKLSSLKEALLVGVIWLILTVVFEFLFGYFVVGQPWSRLFQDYNIVAGRIWILVLIWIMVSPGIFYRIQH